MEASAIDSQIRIQQLSVYENAMERKNLPEDISKLLVNNFLSKVTQTVHYCTLPSIDEMAKHFNCTHMEIYDSIRLLQEHGYDYNFSSLNGNIEIWKIPKKKR